MTAKRGGTRKALINMGERGGGEWESNPPRTVRSVGSFEDCEAHQDPCPSIWCILWHGTAPRPGSRIDWHSRAGQVRASPFAARHDVTFDRAVTNRPPPLSYLTKVRRREVQP